MTNEKREKLNKLRSELESEMFPLIPAKTQELLEKIVAARKPKMILELGSGKGFSGSTMLLSDDNACLVTIEREKENFDAANKAYMEFEFFGRVLPINADANEIVEKFANIKDKQLFDVIFLDCNKSSYIKMADNLIDLLSPGGVLIADDVLYFGKVMEDKEMPEKKHRTIILNLRKFIEKIEKDERLENVTMYEFDNGILTATRKDF